MIKETTSTAKRAFWVMTTLSIVSILAFIMLLIQVVNNSTAVLTLASYVGIGSVGLVAVSSSLGAWFCYKGRMELGLTVVGSGFLAIILIIPFVAKGRAAYVSPVAVILAVAIAPNFFPLNKANRIIALFVGVGIVGVLLDLFLPFERPTPAIRPYTLYVFIAGIFIFLIYNFVQYRRFNLQTKLLTVFISLSLVVVSIVGVFFLNRITNLQQQQVEDKFQLAVHDQAIDIVNFFSEAEADVWLLSNSYALENYLITQQAGTSSENFAVAKTAVQQEFFDFAQTKLIYDQIRFIDADGQEVLRVDTDLEGNSILIPDSQLQNKASRPYFVDTKALPEGEIFVSDLELNVENGEVEIPFTPVLRYSTPIYLGSEFKGIIIVNILADYVLNPLAESGQSFYLVDRDGYFLFNPDPGKQWGRDLETDITLGTEFPEIAENLQTALEDPPSIETDFGLTVYVPVKLETDVTPRWFLLNVISTADILAPVNEALAPLQFVLAIALMLTPLVALFVSQTISRPIVRLSEVAEQMRPGNFDLPLPETTDDEVGILAKALKTMNEELSTLFNSLESRVAARTRDLELAVEASKQLSQVQTVDALLAESVTFIRSQFDLYYTQIYLVEGNVLRLAAGSGDVGRRLMERGHRLPIGAGSINGTAVSEKRSLIVPDTATSTTFKANALLPDTRSEMSVPLIARDTVLGVLNLQSTQPEALNEENRYAFEVIAGQLASAIENARLFTEVTEASAAIEAQMSQLTRQGWDNYLDGIYKQEFLGYAYEGGKLTAVTKPSPLQPNQQKWEINLLDTALGQIVVDSETGEPLPENAQELIQIVSRQVTQHIENLRLLADARRYQEEAEALTNRLIREGWQAYQAKTAVTGFTYDQSQVNALPSSETANAADWATNITVGGAEIGKVTLSKAETPDEQTQEIITAVTAHLGTHIENLRLSAESEAARAEAERRSQELAIINDVAQSVSQLLKPADLLETIFKQVQRALKADAFIVALYDEATGMLNYPLVYDSGERYQPPTGRPAANNPWLQVIQTAKPRLLNRTADEVAEVAARLSAEDAQRLGQAGKVSASLIYVPLYLGQRTIGAISVQSYAQAAYTERDLVLLEGIANHVAVALENARLYTDTQKRAEREALVNSITQKIQSTLTMETALQTAVAELGQALKAKRATVTLNLADKNGHS
ncbi:MAG: GAF domain-containing protein [Anaerolineales bacterium]|nr:GAF domain-containing protein [Anaerolineales bacterium]